MSTNVIDMKGAKEAPRVERSSMETLIISIDMVNRWRLPPWQRPLRVNAKVTAMAEEIKRDGVALSGVITLGRIGKTGEPFIVDGQHRLEAFRISGLTEIIADVRIVHFDSMAEMSDEFVKLNSSLVRMRPDDILRGLEPSSKAMQRIRAACSFVGYDNVRRGGSGTPNPVMGMSILIRCWYSSAPETPVGHLSGRSVTQVAMEMDDKTTSDLIKFAGLCFTAWGREPEFFRLWGGLNFTLCAWLYRRTVLDTNVRGARRYSVLNNSQFRQCLSALAADSAYLDFLLGRALHERDRSPCYSHIRRIFFRRLATEGVEKAQLPSPPWWSGKKI